MTTKIEDTATIAGRLMAMSQRMLDGMDADARDAARMREIDALVSGGRLLDPAAIAGEFNQRINVVSTSWYGTECARFMAEQLTAFAAALLTGGAVNAADAAFFSTPDDGKKGDTRAGLRAAIRAAGVEPPSPNDRAAECAECAAVEEALAGQGCGHGRHADEVRALGNKLRDWASTEKARADKAEAAHREAVENGYQDEQRTARRQRARADQARAEADALRAEVAALRGLARSSIAVTAVHAVWYGVSTPTSETIGKAISAALATVPPAKVVDAVRPTVGEAAFLPSEHHAMCNCDGCLAKTPKPEAAGLEL
jgi:hypothetical protein